MGKFDLVRFTDEGFELEVRADSENETVWLTQDEIALLFDTARSTVTYHINNIFSNNELEKNTSVEKFDGMVNMNLLVWAIYKVTKACQLNKPFNIFSSAIYLLE